MDIPPPEWMKVSSSGWKAFPFEIRNLKIDINFNFHHSCVFVCTSVCTDVCDPLFSSMRFRRSSLSPLHCSVIDAFLFRLLMDILRFDSDLINNGFFQLKMCIRTYVRTYVPIRINWGCEKNPLRFVYAIWIHSSL